VMTVEYVGCHLNEIMSSVYVNIVSKYACARCIIFAIILSR
jgi:hypothetical protein